MTSYRDFWMKGFGKITTKINILTLVKSIQPGDRIAIKSTYTRKHDLPFDSRGQTVSVMAIKAIGEVTENQGDGLAGYVLTGNKG